MGPDIGDYLSLLVMVGGIGLVFRERRTFRRNAQIDAGLAELLEP